jgi:hypothetical protein
MAVTTVTLIKTFGNVGSAVSDADALLLQCLAAAQRMAEEYCGFQFDAESSATEYFDQREGQKKLYLNRVNIASTSPAPAVYFDPAWAWGAGTVVGTDGYIVDTANGIISFLTDYPEALRAWKVTYKATGWDSTSAPGSLVWAVTALAAFLYGKSKAGVVGQKNDAIGQNQSNAFETMIPADIRQVLDMHRRWVCEV